MDLLLDSSGDLALVAGRLQTVSGAAEVAQRIRLALSTQRGEWVLNTDFGMPWRELLSKPADLSAVEAEVKAVVSSLKGVDRISSYTATLSESRDLSIAFEVLTSSGETVNARIAPAPEGSAGGLFVVVF